jgi:hypothetical protein
MEVIPKLKKAGLPKESGLFLFSEFERLSLALPLH